MIALLLLLAAIAPTGLVPQAGVDPTATADATEAPEMVLARLYGSVDYIGGDQLADRIGAVIEEQLRPQLAGEEAHRPGITSAVSSQLVPTLQAAMRRRLPDLWRRLVPVFRSALTADEMRDAVAFLGSPAGQAVIAANLAIGPADDDEQDAALLAALPAQHRPAWIAYRASEIGRKLRNTGEALGEAGDQWSQDIAPALATEAEQSVERMVAQYRTGKTR